MCKLINERGFRLLSDRPLTLILYFCGFIATEKKIYTLPLLLCLWLVPFDTSIAAEKNGYQFIFEATTKIAPNNRPALRDFISNEEWLMHGLRDDTADILQKWLNKNEEALQLLNRGLLHKPWQFPLMNLETFDNMEHVPGFPLRNIALLKIAEGAIALSKGNLTKGIDSFLDVFTFADQLANGERATLTNFILANHLHQFYARVALERICLDHSPQRKIFEKIINSVPLQHGPNLSALNCLQGELYFYDIPFLDFSSKNIMQDINALGLEQKQFFDLAESQHLIKAIYAFFLERNRKNWNQRVILTWPSPQWQSFQENIDIFLAMALKDLQIPNKFLEKNDFQDAIDNQFQIQRTQKEVARRHAINEVLNLLSKKDPTSEDIHKWKKFAKRAHGEVNLIGKFWVVKHFANNTFDLHCRQAMVLRVLNNRLITLAAIKLYEKEQDEMPSHLEDLVSAKILQILPEDLFSGKPFHYAPEKKLLWSVGPDGIDDKGDPKNDLVLRLE